MEKEIKFPIDITYNSAIINILKMNYSITRWWDE